MPPSLEQKVREAVIQYIAGLVSLRQFQEWFASRTWNVDSVAEADDLRQLVNEIDLLLAECSSGHWTEQELRDKLYEYRRVVQPMKDLGGVLWSEVQAPYVYVVRNEASGYVETLYPGSSLPSPSPRIDVSPLVA
ncbi:MAG: hypothetical protein ACRELA_21745 [Candidatus Rokuibacteriota bacterium]